MKTPPIWHGTPQEAEDLRQALNVHCQCAVPEAYATTLGCEAHSLLSNQRLLDGLIFGRRMRRRLLGEEFGMPLAERRAP